MLKGLLFIILLVIIIGGIILLIMVNFVLSIIRRLRRGGYDDDDFDTNYNVRRHIISVALKRLIATLLAVPNVKKLVSHPPTVILLNRRLLLTCAMPRLPIVRLSPTTKANTLTLLRRNKVINLGLRILLP